MRRAAMGCWFWWDGYLPNTSKWLSIKQQFLYAAMKMGAIIAKLQKRMPIWFEIWIKFRFGFSAAGRLLDAFGDQNFWETSGGDIMKMRILFVSESMSFQ
jgi:hypothetical protein